jgi:hypothetical protein
MQERSRDRDAFGKTACAVYAEQYPCSTEFNFAA